MIGETGNKLEEKQLSGIRECLLPVLYNSRTILSRDPSLLTISTKALGYSAVVNAIIQRLRCLFLHRIAVLFLLNSHSNYTVFNPILVNTAPR